MQGHSAGYVFNLKIETYYRKFELSQVILMKCLSILIFLFTFIVQVQAQNNSISCIIWGIGEPYITFGAWQAALSYERKFTEHHSFLLDGSVVLLSGSNVDCTSYSIRYNGTVSYRYYFISERKFMNRFWLSPGLKYQKFDLQSCYEEGLSEFYGIRFMVGKQVNLSKNADNWFVDLGLGASYGYRLYSYYKATDSWGDIISTTLPDPDLLFIPELLFRVGIRF